MNDWPSLNPVAQYWIDAWQRSILFLDTLRQRGNIYQEQRAKQVPHVLQFEHELIVDGRKLPRPVNYGLVRIIPPAGIKLDPEKHPIIVVDPRAGHGPGIGGMKHDSQIGVALKGGHPCYFIGFSPHPMPGQTVEDVCVAEAQFVEEVARRHPDAVGKPVLIGNCQAGWQIMMMAAIKPDLPGPIMLAGSPLSYWAGVRGKNPLRYLGGLLGGTWLTALCGDLGNGIFDGAYLVQNFESLNPANTLWNKPYNVYSKVDTETERFLEFETWWGSPVLLNAEEMQWITDNLFVGNKLSRGQIQTSSGVRVDLRNIKSPIIVFCSWGDNITPPQQALDWILDLYDDEKDIIGAGQTIVYTLHRSIGHLGIFVSGKVATKEHDELISCMELIEALPPGLYEAVVTEVDENTRNPDLVHGRYLFRLETRTLNDIRAMGGNDATDELRFATAARLSEINLGLYKNFVSPMVRNAVGEQTAELLRATHPNRLRFRMLSDQNPMMSPIKALAEAVRSTRHPVSADNPLLAVEKAASSWITMWLQTCGEMRDAIMEMVFLNTYGSPWLRSLAGFGTQQGPSRHIERDLLRETAMAQLRLELEHRFEEGHIEDAVMRALIYIRLPERAVDERGFAMLKLIRESRPAYQRITLAQFKHIVKQQYLLLCLNEQKALDTLPKLLPSDESEHRSALDAVRRVLSATGSLSGEGKRRLARIEELFGTKASTPQQETANA
jgi:pimeloyl-ACP methyl ester carboxylesterase